MQKFLTFFGKKSVAFFPLDYCTFEKITLRQLTTPLVLGSSTQTGQKSCVTRRSNGINILSIYLLMHRRIY